MNDNGFITAEEMKIKLGLKPESKDNRTLNKYVQQGKLEFEFFSKKVKLYRFVGTRQTIRENNFANDDWFFDSAEEK